MFNPSAIDTLPKEVQTGLMFGGPFPAGIPVPDIDRTRYLLIIGANPAISHGSLMTMPDAPGRLRGVIQRGGKVVVIDPRRTETARRASEHHFIRPGTDAAFLLALVHTLFEEGLVTLGAAEGLVAGLDTVRASAEAFAPERISDRCGIPAAVIRRLSLVAPVEVTPDLMPGVVSLPHGWGHDVDESCLDVAKKHPGVNTNLLTDDQAYDTATGTAVLFGTPVIVEPAGR